VAARPIQKKQGAPSQQRYKSNQQVEWARPKKLNNANNWVSVIKMATWAI